MGTDVSLVVSLSISPWKLLTHPWDTQTHLEGIVSGIDTVPRVMKNEFPCHDVNTNDLSREAFAQIRFDPPPPPPYLRLLALLSLSPPKQPSQ